MPDSADVLDKLRDLVVRDHPADDTAAMHTRAMALVARLKALNRAANTATRVCKDNTVAARLEMDQSHLQLQNLLYEKRHLEREIDKCRQFACVAGFPCRQHVHVNLQFNIPGRASVLPRGIQKTCSRRSPHGGGSGGRTSAYA